MRRPATPSHFVRVDGFDLRVLTIVAASCLSVYFYFQPEPLLVAVYWILGFVGLNLYRIAALSLRRRARPQERHATELTNGVYSALTWHEYLQNEAIVRELMDWRSSRLVVCFARLLEASLEEGHG